MNTYPQTPKIRINSSRTLKNPTFRSGSESGYTFTRKKWTKPKSAYSLAYPNLTHDEFKTLQDFFIANQGLKFRFKHPLENDTKICVFAMDEIRADDNMQGFCSTKIELVEV